MFSRSNVNLSCVPDPQSVKQLCFLTENSQEVQNILEKVDRYLNFKAFQSELHKKTEPAELLLLEQLT